jgi:hypothetical protein
MSEQNKDAERAAYLAWYMETYQTRPVAFDGSSDYLAFVSGLHRGQARSLPAGVPDVLFDGFAVLNALSDKAKARTSSENVSDVLDAVVKLLRDEAAPTVKAEPAPAQDERDLFKPYRLAGKFCVSRGIDDDDSEIRPKILDAFCSGYACAAHPAQTEQQATVKAEQVPVAEVQHDCIIVLRHQSNGDRWPVGTKLYAAPTVKAEQVRLPERKRTDHLPKEYKTMTTVRAAIEAYNRALDDVAALNAIASPSLPAAGSAVEAVEVRGLQWFDTEHYRKHPPKFGYNPHNWNPLMTVAQHERIVVALSDELQTERARADAAVGDANDAERALSALKAQPDPWQASGADWCSSIHRNPDAKAWADFFVAVFPGQADKHELMTGWFANAMMAMHDHLKSQQSAHVSVPRDRLKWVIDILDHHTAYDHSAEASAARELRALLNGGEA